jgi:hypothetical protein
MSQRNSGYGRIEADLYETPEWVTKALLPYLPDGPVWEPAAGGGKISAALERAGRTVISSDIADGRDFLLAPALPNQSIIVTNPPFRMATAFIEKALRLKAPAVAMLLRTDFDHAKTRRHLFRDEPRFAQKLVLTRRIVWFDRPGAAPSFNHAWFLWKADHCGAPTLSYYVETP